ncbi:nicotinate-nucleotide--dimethylbenzimidazole phosphoribosyltransferase [Stackebrandtia soli]|uniref:nicotinate-nucleotide--dimethylbenzimidazole phosphoribosyltransferase n=1 Tax=Stackebrandtia soli TaxID=1892856 RepID=UPI0039EAE4BC
MSDDITSPFANARVPFPDASFATRAKNRLAQATVPGTGLGGLGSAVAWAARVQGTDRPTPFLRIDGIVVSGAHFGGFVESTPVDVDVLRALADTAGIPLTFIETEPTGAAESAPLLTVDEYEEALERGRAAADAAIDGGADAIVLIGLGPGVTAAAIGVAAHLTRTPPIELSPRVHVPGGLIDDETWMRQTAALRDAFARAGGPGRNAAAALSEFGGPVLAIAAAVIVAAAIRRTPVLIDGPAAAAAALAARDFSLGAPKWCYAPDRVPHPVVEKMASQTGMADPIGPGLDIGDGCAVLNAVPLLQDALTLAARLPYPADVDDRDRPDGIVEEEPEDPADDDPAVTGDGLSH